MTHREQNQCGEGRRNPFFYLKCISALFFLFSLAAIVWAGMLFSDISVVGAGVSAEMGRPGEGGAVGEFHFALSIVSSLVAALLAGVIFTFAAIADRMVRAP